MVSRNVIGPGLRRRAHSAHFNPATTLAFALRRDMGWVMAGAVIAVGVAYVLRGPAKAQEASAAVGTPLDQGA